MRRVGRPGATLVWQADVASVFRPARAAIPPWQDIGAIHQARACVKPRRHSGTPVNMQEFISCGPGKVVRQADWVSGVGGFIHPRVRT